MPDYRGQAIVLQSERDVGRDKPFPETAVEGPTREQVAEYRLLVRKANKCVGQLDLSANPRFQLR